jgi:hypothetical protein
MNFACGASFELHGGGCLQEKQLPPVVVLVLAFSIVHSCQHIAIFGVFLFAWIHALLRLYGMLCCGSGVL